MNDLLTTTFYAVLAAGFLVGVVVGLTGMGGGALMTPALIFLGVGDASTVVTADLTAAAVYKTGGALVHRREGSPHMTLVKWLVLGSVPTALLGPHLVSWAAPPGGLDRTLKLCIGFALLLAATTYALRLYLNLRRMRSGRHADDEAPDIRPVPTLMVGAVGGLLVGITSVGSGSVIMIALLMLYPGLSALRLVGTDLVQAVPLVLAAAVSNIALHGLDWGLTIPLVLGSVPGTVLGSLIAPKVRQSFIRRGIVVVLVMSGIGLLDKGGWAPLGAAEGDTHPLLVASVGLAMLLLVPVSWGLLRLTTGLPMFGSPTLAEVEDPSSDPEGGGCHVADPPQFVGDRSRSHHRAGQRAVPWDQRKPAAWGRDARREPARSHRLCGHDRPERCPRAGRRDTSPGCRQGHAVPLRAGAERRTRRQHAVGA